MDEVRALAAELAPYLERTPVRRWSTDAARAWFGTDTEVWLKLELFQHAGSFKPRGALAVMLGLSPAQRARGVTAVSAGNHAVATAFAARALGVSATVVMLRGASPVRVAAAQALGAEVRFADDGAAAFATAEALAEREGRALVHPFEGPRTALGTATLGLELCEQVPDLDAVVVAIGGGGLCAGVATAVRALRPGCRVLGVEPEGADSMSRSFAAGSPVTLPRVDTIADSLAPPMALPYSYALCRRGVERIALVDDDALCAAMALLYHDAKLAVEPAGAAAVAALMGPLRGELAGARVAAIVCGANLDLDTFAAHVQRGEPRLARVPG